MQTKKVTAEQKIEKEKIQDLLVSNGIIQEANRSYFHPIGLELRLNDTNLNLVEIWKTEEEFVFSKINKMFLQKFSEYSSKRNEQRKNKLGFIIQTQDFYTKEIPDNLVYKSSKRIKIETITKCLSIFANLMYKKILKHHEEKDNNFDYPQYNKEVLLNRLYHSLKNEDWISVANYSMMLDMRPELIECLFWINDNKNKEAIK